jgi:hypothetical protein
MDFDHPILTKQMIENLPEQDTSDMNPIDTFVHDYSVFTKIINLIIINKITGPMTPMLKMYANVSTYIEDSFTTGDIFESTCADFSDGMVWLFNEISPIGYLYQKGRFISGALTDTAGTLQDKNE